MRLEPGPLPALAPALDQLQPEPAQFEQLINASLADLPQADDDLGALVDSLGGLDLPADIDNIDPNLDTADEALNELGGFVTSLYVDNAEAAAALAQGNLQLVAGEAPAEIWQPVPEPQSGASGRPSHEGENGPTSLSIQNLTRPGDQNFYSGDQFSLIVQIDSGGGNFDFAGKPLSLTRTINGADQGELPIGSTDQFGRLVYQSTFDPSSVGLRVFGLDPPGYGTNPQLTLTVNPGPAPATPGPGQGQQLSARLDNLSTGDSSTLHVGDVWQEVITGPLSQPVYMRQVKNGVDMGELFVGYTDPTGALVYGGKILSSQLGTYTETFRVGTSNVPIQLNFSVIP